MGAEVIILANPYTCNFLKGLTHSAFAYHIHHPWITQVNTGFFIFKGRLALFGGIVKLLSHLPCSSDVLITGLPDLSTDFAMLLAASPPPFIRCVLSESGNHLNACLARCC